MIDRSDSRLDGGVDDERLVAEVDRLVDGRRRRARQVEKRAIEAVPSPEPDVAAEASHIRRRLEAKIVLEIEVGPLAVLGVEPRVGLAVGDERAEHDAGALAVLSGLGVRRERQQRYTGDRREQTKAERHLRCTRALIKHQPSVCGTSDFRLMSVPAPTDLHLLYSKKTSAYSGVDALRPQPLGWPRPLLGRWGRSS